MPRESTLLHTSATRSDQAESSAKSAFSVPALANVLALWGWPLLQHVVQKGSECSASELPINIGGIDPVARSDALQTAWNDSLCKAPDGKPPSLLRIVVKFYGVRKDES